MKHITIISPDGNKTKVARLDKQGTQKCNTTVLRTQDTKIKKKILTNQRTGITGKF